MQVIDRVKPEGKWAFDESVTLAFDDMLRRSIPQYDLMRESVFHLGYELIQPKTYVVDLGCARGEALAPFIDKFGAYNTYIGVDVSEPMLEAARSRFKGFIETGLVAVKNFDLRSGYPATHASLTLSILTLQFIPIEHRLRIIRDVFKSTINGGAFILVEKILGSTAEIDALQVKQYYNLKRSNGYSQDDIERKKLSLEGVLVPVTARWNEEMLVGAGFRHVDCFWRWQNFAGWVAIKE